MVDADKCTVFMLDEKAHALWFQSGETLTRLELSAPSIAATVAKTGNAINIPDAYADDRFDEKSDLKTGYKTKSLLCVPMRSGEKVVGVVQVVNKATGAFDEADEEMMATLLGLAGPVLHGATAAAGARDTVRTERSPMSAAGADDSDSD